MPSFYQIKQSHNYNSNGHSEEEDDTYTIRTYTRDFFGHDLLDVLSAINLVEDYFELDRSIWHPDYRPPNIAKHPHMVIQNQHATKEYLRDRIDYIRSSAGVAAFNWQYTPADLTEWQSSSGKTGVNLRHILELKQAIGRIIGSGNPDRKVQTIRYTHSYDNIDGERLRYTGSDNNTLTLNLSASCNANTQKQIRGSKGTGTINFNGEKWKYEQPWADGLHEWNDTLSYSRSRTIVGVKISYGSGIGEEDTNGLETFEQNNLSHISFFENETNSLYFKNRPAVNNIPGKTRSINSYNFLETKVGSVRMRFGHPIFYSCEEYPINSSGSSDGYEIIDAEITGSSSVETSNQLPDGSTRDGYTFYTLSFPLTQEQIISYIDAVFAARYDTNKDQVETYWNTNDLADIRSDLITDMGNAVSDAEADGYLKNLITAGGFGQLDLSAYCSAFLDPISASYSEDFVSPEPSSYRWLYWDECVLFPNYPVFST